MLGWATVLALLIATPTAIAATTHEKLAAEIAETATLVQGGHAVLVTVRVACPAGSRIIEAFAYVTQDGNQSQFGFMPLTCDGAARHAFVVRADAPDKPFHFGTARASAYVLLENESASPTRIVRLRPPGDR
jgi:hypothetical protein